MMINRYHFGLIILFLFWLVSPIGAVAKPLRLLVPSFYGPNPTTQYVRTTVYLEMIRAFRSIDSPERGAWILYEEEPLESPTHDAVITLGSWPSVRADLAVWGEVYPFDDGVAMQLHLTIMPLLNQRENRPELWSIQINGHHGPIRMELGLPGQFYTFEPQLLTSDAVIRSMNPYGVPLYSKRFGGVEIGRLEKVMYFYEIHQDALKVKTGNKLGWVRIKPMAKQESEAIDFCKGVVRLLRGDYTGAGHNFSQVIEKQDIPQSLRIHSLICLGLSRELKGNSGRQQFEKAYELNRLDKVSAAYLLMSLLADINRMQSRGDLVKRQQTIAMFSEDLSRLRVLFAENDPWMQKLMKIF